MKRFTVGINMAGSSAADVPEPVMASAGHATQPLRDRAGIRWPGS
jgi:hypothetical protein